MPEEIAAQASGKNDPTFPIATHWSIWGKHLGSEFVDGSSSTNGVTGQASNVRDIFYALLKDLLTTTYDKDALPICRDASFGLVDGLGFGPAATCN